MKSYGFVYIEKGGILGARIQRALYMDLKKAKIIKISKAEIETDYEAISKSSCAGFVINIVFQNESERDVFRKIMRSREFKMTKIPIKWRTTSYLGKNNEFRKWLEKKGNYEDGRSKKV